MSNESYLDARDLSTIQKLDALDKRQVSAQAVLPGQVVFSYGSGIPTVVCALFEITDISMEKGERVFTVQLGDSTRWLIDSAVSGSGADRTEHIVVKALDNGLKTSLIITTNRRTYHIALKSSQKDFMPAVSFNYPGTSLKLNSPYYDGGDTKDRFDYSLASSQRTASDYSTVSLIIVGAAVVVKIVLGRYVKSVGKKVNSSSLVNSGEERDIPRRPRRRARAVSSHGRYVSP